MRRIIPSSPPNKQPRLPGLFYACRKRMPFNVSPDSSITFAARYAGAYLNCVPRQKYCHRARLTRAEYVPTQLAALTWVPVVGSQCLAAFTRSPASSSQRRSNVFGAGFSFVHALRKAYRPVFFPPTFSTNPASSSGRNKSIAP